MTIPIVCSRTKLIYQQMSVQNDDESSLCIIRSLVRIWLSHRPITFHHYSASIIQGERRIIHAISVIRTLRLGANPSGKYRSALQKIIYHFRLSKSYSSFDSQTPAATLVMKCARNRWKCSAGKALVKISAVFSFEGIHSS